MSPAWPPGWMRAKYRQRSQFRVTFSSATHEILYELKRAGASNVRIDTDVPVRKDGLPYGDAARRTLVDPGVVVYWTKDGVQFAMACDHWSDVASNMRAVALTLKAKRDIRRWGAASEKAEYEGYRALPPPSGRPEEYLQPDDVVPPHVVLGVHERASKAEVKAAYRRLVLEAHPDKGGSSAQLARITEAYQALTEGS